MARTKKKAKLEEAKMDLTPMIDVTFLLLVFFMLASKFKTQEGQILSYLPKDRGQASASSKDVTETRVYVDWCHPSSYQPSQNRKIGRPVLYVIKPGESKKRLEVSGAPNYPALLAYMKNLKAQNPKSPVILDGHQYVPWRFIMASLDEVVEAGLSEVTFALRGKPIK